MTMNETLMLVVAGVTGLVLGAIFFGGLWWTVRKGVSSPRPALWFLGSTLLRMSIVLAGFYFVGRGHWERLARVSARICHRTIRRDAVQTRTLVEHPELHGEGGQPCALVPTR